VRLEWKLSVLGALSRAGVWLEDASIIAVYGTGPIRRANGLRYRRLLRESFELFVWPDVSRDNPEQVWVIGRGVGEALAGLPMIQADHVISQPQDRNGARYESDVRRLVADIVRNR
jgi:hypothetical protein